MPAKPLIHTSIARAKINLTLHVGRVNAQGFHPLHSLVVFANIGDYLSAQIANKFSLEVHGPFADGLTNGNDNLVLMAAKNAALINGIPIKLAYKLTKNLPVSSGIGGGSADAGAAVRLLEKFNGQGKESLDKHLLETGADVPVCHLSQTCLMEGIGENLTPLPSLGHLPAILVNPGVGVSTAKIFKTFDIHGKSSDFHVTGDTLLGMAKSGTNDLQDIAIKIAPIIQTVIDEIERQDGCNLARMSGSGATCFGLFENMEQARRAVAKIKRKYPNWWCVATMLGDE